MGSQQEAAHMRMWWRLAGLAVALAIVVAAEPAAVRAAVNCGDGSAVNRFDGNRSDSPRVFAVQGKIRDRQINLCLDPGNSDDDSGASIWVMVAGWNPNEYAQVGYARIAGMAAPQAFVEYNDGENVAPGWARIFYPGIWVNGAQHTYVVDYSGITGKLYFAIDGLSKGSTPWSPDSEWSTPWEGQFYAETWDRGDDVPGVAGARADWSLLAVQIAEPGVWVNPEGAVLTSDLSVYKNGWSSWPTAFQTWTQR